MWFLHPTQSMFSVLKIYASHGDYYFASHGDQAHPSFFVPTRDFVSVSKCLFDGTMQVNWPRDQIKTVI